MSTVAGVGDLVQRTGDGCTGRVLGGRAVERFEEIGIVYFVFLLFLFCLKNRVCSSHGVQLAGAA
jgi:hypothetical protein